MTYGTVVVGTDGSETAERAVRQAGELAGQHGARLVIVTAYEPGAGGEHDPLDDNRVPGELKWMLTDASQAEARAEAGRSIASAAGATRITVQAIEGAPGDVLLTAADDFGADCIVVGSRGLTAPLHAVLGSVASSVGHHAPCDVLIVHTSG